MSGTRGIRTWCWALFTLLALCAPAAAQGSRPDPAGPPTRVEASVYILDFRSIDSARQSFTANVFLYLTWRDPRLAHDGPGNLTQPRLSVWNPRPQIVNQEVVRTSFPDEVEIAPDGQVVFRQRYFGNFSQPLDLTEFPFDHHAFGLEFIFAGYGPDQIELVPCKRFPSGVAADHSLPDWKITSHSTRISTHDPMPQVKGPCSFTLELQVQRYVGYYLLKVLLPLALVLAMSWMVFWIDPEQFGVQISLSVTSMLTLITYRFMITSHLPKVSYLTRLDVVILGATLMVFAGLCEAVIASGLARAGRTELARAIDRKARWIAPLLFLMVLALARLR